MVEGQGRLNAFTQRHEHNKAILITTGLALDRDAFNNYLVQHAQPSVGGVYEFFRNGKTLFRTGGKTVPREARRQSSNKFLLNNFHGSASHKPLVITIKKFNGFCCKSSLITSHVILRL